MDKPIDKIITDLQNYTDDFEASKNHLMQVLNALDMGVFFLNSQFIIEKTYSDCLTEMLCMDELAEYSFIDILENKVPEKTINETLEYLVLMFAEEHEERAISELNPLTKIEMHSTSETGLWEDSKHLSFKFKRIVDNHGEFHLIGMVSDISPQIELSNKLEDFEKWSNRQIQWLISLLHIELPLLKEFVAVVEYELSKINKVIKTAQSTSEYSIIVPKIARSINHINSSAVILNLDFFTKETYQLKEEIETIKNNTDLSGPDFVNLVVQLGSMQRMVGEIKELMKHIKGLDNSLRTTRRFDGGLLIRLIENLIKHITENSGKKILLKYHNFNNMNIPFKYKQMIKEFLIALTRFVVEFGIEDSDKRKSLNVNPEATIEIESLVEHKSFLIKFRHDGNVMRIERLLQESVEKTPNDSEEPMGLDESIHPGSEVLRLFFSPDIASLERRGTTESMQIMNDFEMVKKKLKIHGGRIKVTFTSESFCEYTIALPLFERKKQS